MSAYTVVITPNSEAGSEAGQSPEIIIKIETENPNPRIVEMTIRSSFSGGVSTVAFADFDLDAVVLALSAGARGSHEGPRAPEASDDMNDWDDEVVLRKPVDETNAAFGFAGEPEANSAQSASARSSGAPRGSVTRRGRRSQTGGEQQSARPYRQMPDIDEVLAALEQAGSITGMAAHFDVPRHTAAGWMTRVRKSRGQA